MEQFITTCKKCHTKLSLPKNRGLLEVTCPKCKYIFDCDTGPKLSGGSMNEKNAETQSVNAHTEQRGRQLIIKRNADINGMIVKWTLILDGVKQLTIGSGETITVPISSDAHVLKVQNGNRIPLFSDSGYIPAESKDCYVTLRIDNSKQWTTLKINNKTIGVIEVNQTQETGVKGFFGNIQKDIQRNKDEAAAEREWIREHPGSEAICEYFYQLFQEGWPGYNWLKSNRGYPLYLKIDFSGIKICYNDPTAKTLLPQDVIVQSYSYQEIYNWYGLKSQDGFSYLDKKIHKDELNSMIIERILQHPHIKYSGGLVLRMFR